MSDDPDLFGLVTQEPPTDDLDLEFRVILIDGKRRGFRLEKLFWRLLDDISKRRGLRRSKLVAGILARGEMETKNAAGAVRGFVARAIEEERHGLHSAFAQPKQVSLLQQAPVPAFAINRYKRLQQVNSEFNQLVRVTVGNMSQTVTSDTLRLTLDTKIEELFIEAQANGSATCNYSIFMGQHGRRGRTKLVAVPPYPSEVLVGYVVS